MLKLKLRYLATWCEELTHWKRPWCWERLRTEGEGGDRGRDGWMGIISSMDMSLSKLQEIVKEMEDWYAAVHGVTKICIWLNNWATMASGKEPANAGVIRFSSLIPGSKRSPGGRHGYPLHHSCLENPKDRGAWQATVHRVTKSGTRLKQLGTHVCTHRFMHKLLFWIDSFSTLSPAA